LLAGFRAAWRGLRHFNHRGYIYIWGNLIWVVLSLPIITAPLAWAGLVKMSFLAQTTPSANLSDLWDAFRTYWRQGVVMGIANIAIIGLNVYNLAAYWNEDGQLFILLRYVWVVVLVGWVVLQLYLWPLFFAMKKPALGGALRNALVMVMLNPGFTLGVWLVVLLIVVVSIALAIPWLLLTVGALASLSTAAVLDRLEAAGIRERPASSVVIDTDMGEY
jgi:uncharacterized membrane protein YesL